MSLSKIFTPPSTDIDWMNPAQVEQWAISFGLAVQQQLGSGLSGGTYQSPEHILIEGKPLPEYIDDTGLWTGCLVLYDGTLSEARRWGNQRGYDICDGSGGAPDLRNKFIRIAGAESGSGGLGGCSTGDCTLTLGVCINAHDFDHYHGLYFPTCCKKILNTVADQELNMVDPTDSRNSTNYVYGDSTLTHSGSVSGCQKVSIAVEPPYYEAIILRKR